MKTRVFAVCTIIFLFCGIAHADSAKLVNPANGHTYQRFDTVLTWDAAKNACAGLGGYLATVTTQAENDWIQDNITNGVRAIWVGGTDAVVEGTWSWINGESWHYTNWGSGEPNGGTSANCLRINYTNGQWDDGMGSFQSSYLCEWDNSVCTNVAVKPHTFTVGTPAKSAEVNADFDMLYLYINAQNCQIQALKAAFCQDHTTASVCQ